MRSTPRISRSRRNLGLVVLAGGALLAGTAGSAVAGAPAPTPYLPLQITKTADPAYTVVNTWDVDKWSSPRAGWDKKDQSVAVDYSVKVTRRSRKTKIEVTGFITVKNPNQVAFRYEVGDTLPNGECRLEPLAPPTPAAAGQIVSPLPTVAGGGEATWFYACALDAIPKDPIYNTGWVRFAPEGLGPLVVTPADATSAGNVPTTLPGYAKVEVEVDFAKALVNVVNPAVKVIDTLDGDQTRLLDDALTSSKTFTYKRYLSFWRVKKICRTWHNVAKITPAQPAPVPAIVQQDEAAPDLAADWSKTAESWVKICPPPPPDKGEDPAPPKVEVSPGPGDTKSDPVEPKPVDNPKGPVIKDNASKGRLLVSKSASVRTARVGDLVSWTIRVTNAGSAELYGVKVTDLLPKHLVLAPTSLAKGGKGTVFTVGDLAPGASEVIEVTTRVAGRPVPTSGAVTAARRIATAKDRDAALRRLRKGLVCNVVKATARKAGSDADIACIRIVRQPVPVPAETP